TVVNGLYAFGSVIEANGTFCVSIEGKRALLADEIHVQPAPGGIGLRSIPTAVDGCHSPLAKSQHYDSTCLYGIYTISDNAIGLGIHLDNFILKDPAIQVG